MKNNSRPEANRRVSSPNHDPIHTITNVNPLRRSIASDVSSLVFKCAHMEWSNRCIAFLRNSTSWRLSATCLAAALLVLPCGAQELQPRRWSHLPIDTNFAGVGYAYTDADIAFDPVLLIEDAEFALQSFPLKYIRTFELAGKSARVDWLQAYQDAEWSGLLDGVPTRVERSGWSDMVLRFAMNIIGAPPLSGRRVRRIQGRSTKARQSWMGLEVQLPTGQYLNDKLLNLGTNRFTFRPQLGVVHRRGNGRRK